MHPLLKKILDPPLKLRNRSVGVLLAATRNHWRSCEGLYILILFFVVALFTAKTKTTKTPLDWRSRIEWIYLYTHIYGPLIHVNDFNSHAKLFFKLAVWNCAMNKYYWTILEWFKTIIPNTKQSFWNVFPHGRKKML